MRDFGRLRHLRRSLPGGLLVAALATPHLLQRLAAPAAVLCLTIVTLALASISIWQAHCAWRRHVRAPQSCGETWRQPAPWLLLLAAAVAAVLMHLAADRYFLEFHPNSRPRTLLEFAAGLAWAMTFQALVLVVFPYTFAARLWRRPAVTLVAVVLFAQLLTFLQMQRFGLSVAAAATLVAGGRALLLAACYHRGGLVGLALGSGVCYSRFLIRLLADQANL